MFQISFLDYFSWLELSLISLLDHIALQLDREGIKGREDGERSADGRFFEGGDYLKYFHQRRAIIRGR